MRFDPWVGQSAFFVDLSADHGFDEEEIRDFRGALEAGYREWGTVTQRPMFLPEFAAMGRASSSRARLLRQVFGDLLPDFPQVRAVAFGDSELFAMYFGVPRFGIFADEVTAWREKVRNNPYYVNSVTLAPLIVTP